LSSDKISDQTMEFARMLERIKERFPEAYRHIVGLIRSILL